MITPVVNSSIGSPENLACFDVRRRPRSGPVRKYAYKNPPFIHMSILLRPFQYGRYRLLGPVSSLNSDDFLPVTEGGGASLAKNCSRRDREGCL